MILIVSDQTLRCIQVNLQVSAHCDVSCCNAHTIHARTIIIFLEQVS